MKEKEYREDIYPEIYDQEPMLLSAGAMRVFPVLPLSVDSDKLQAEILRNLAGYYFDNLIFLYYPSACDPVTGSHLCAFSRFLKEENLQYDVGNWVEQPFAIKEAVSFIDKFKNFPPPPESVHIRLKIIYEYIQKVLQLIGRQNADFLGGLYNLSVSWSKIQTEPIMHLSSASYILRAAEHQNKKFERRQNRSSYQFYIWGKEYDEYYQEYREAGVSERTSRKYAGIKFSENHPYTGNVNTNPLPGKSLNSLKKYQKIYRNWRRENA